MPAGFVLVTGASAGIGTEIARVAAADGRDLILTARRVDRLEALAEELRAAHGVDVRVRPADLADPAAPAELHEWTVAEGLAVETLVNNAGFGSVGPFHELDRETELRMIRLNVLALADLTHRFLPAMIEAGGGRILNVASMAGFQPGPFMATYYATKAFVLHFTEAIASELRGTGVTATALCPGPVPTEFGEVAGMRHRGFPPAVSAPRVARVGWRGAMRGKAVVIPGFTNRGLTFTVRLLPRSWVRAFLKMGQRRLIESKR